MGASIGTSAVVTMLARRAQVHQAMLASYTGAGRPLFSSSASTLADVLKNQGAAQPQTQAYAMLYRSMKDQASGPFLHIDTFWLLGVATGIMFVFSFFLNKNNPRSRGKQETLAH